jgi:hypothetical protein
MRNIVHEFWQQHSGLACVLSAIIFVLSGWANYKTGFKLLALSHWFLGLVVLSLGIAISSLFLGLFRWPIAAIVFITGTCILWRFMRDKI